MKIMCNYCSTIYFFPKEKFCPNCQKKPDINTIQYYENLNTISNIISKKDLINSEHKNTYTTTIDNLIKINLNLLKNDFITHNKEEWKKWFSKAKIIPNQKKENINFSKRQAIHLCKKIRVYIEGSIHYRYTISTWKKYQYVKKVSRKQLILMLEHVVLNLMNKIDIDATIKNWKKLNLIRYN